MRLEAAGFRVGTVAKFLELTPEENELLETCVALAKHEPDERVLKNGSSGKKVRFQGFDSVKRLRN